MHILEFSVNRQNIIWNNPCRVPVEGSRGVVYARFELDSEWDGLGVRVLFENEFLGEKREDVWTGEPVPVPETVLSRGTLTVGLVGLGEDGAVRLTTKKMPRGIPVAPSAGLGGDPVEEVTPSMVEKLQAASGTALDAANKANDAATAAEQATNAAETAATAANTAADSATTATDNALAATSSAATAATAARSAASSADSAAGQASAAGAKAASAADAANTAAQRAETAAGQADTIRNQILTDKENGVFDGEDGVSPDFQMGTVETLGENARAEASITGTQAKPVLNLKIPRGKQGEQGRGISRVGSNDDGSWTIYYTDNTNTTLSNEAYVDLLKKMQNALSASQTATENAKTATSSANTAADRANESAATADTAADTANQAASGARDAASKANMAAETVQTAIDAANTAAGRADQSADTADTAATNANSAKDTALDAASTANAAANDANQTAQSLVAAKEAGEFNGPQGEPFEYEDFTPAQLEALRGPAGKDAVPFTLLGRFETLDALNAAHPIGEAGTGYAVGTETDNVIYIWDVDGGVWKPIGRMNLVPQPTAEDIGKVLVVNDEGTGFLFGEAVGSGGAIFDVVELPTENIDKEVFYRVVTGTFMYNGFSQNTFVCYCVSGLPEVGEPATSDMETVTAYYNVEDGVCYGYVDSMLSSYFGVPVGWYDVAILFPAAGWKYGGVITSLNEATMADRFYLLVAHEVFSFCNGIWTSHKPVGTKGAGVGAEVFNHPTNTASGDAAHAEGYQTTASGNYSHAEGAATFAENEGSHAEGAYTISRGAGSHAEGIRTRADESAAHAEGSDTVADGGHSHAEGYKTTAKSEYSHAEGAHSKAVGVGSHAEGFNSVANGDYSHAEGRETVATAANSHVQGKYNVEDTGKQYAHIVGNGNSSSARSNAHTLDWDGNAWYAGTVEGTALILRSSTEGSTKKFRITVDDSGTLTATEVV